MKNLSLLILVTFISLSGFAQPEIPSIEWQHIDSKKSGIKSPNSGIEQTSDVVFDIDKDGINDLIITERTSAPSVVWYKKNGDSWDKFVIDDEKRRIEAGATFYDIDNDGDLDPVFAGEGRSNEVWWWENPYPNFNKNTPWKRYTIKKSGENKQHDQLIADFDGDGLGELVFWNQNANALFLADVPENPKELDEWDFKAIYVYSTDGQMQPPGFDILLQNGTGETLSTVEGVDFGAPVGLQLYSLRYELKKDVPVPFRRLQTWELPRLKFQIITAMNQRNLKNFLINIKWKYQALCLVLINLLMILNLLPAKQNFLELNMQV